MQHLFTKILIPFYFYFFVFNFYKLMAQAAISSNAIGKHQIVVGNHSKLKIDMMDNAPMGFKNFDIKPNETILKNDGNSLVIQMTYNMDRLPRLSLSDSDFYFEYMYFQWLMTIPKRFSYENIAFHGQLHVVFYNSKFKDFDQAFEFDGVVMLVFNVKVNPLAMNKYEELQKYLKFIQQPATQTVIKNMPLAYWLNVSMEQFCINTGTLTIGSSCSSVIWLDVAEPIEMTPEVVFEFQHLQSADGKPLMNQYQPVTLDKVSIVYICNYTPTEELEIKNMAANRFKTVQALIILSQVVIIMTFRLPSISSSL